VDQVQENGLFLFPLDIAITGQSPNPGIKKLMISKKSETFIFTVKDKPLKITADPFTSLLFNCTIDEIK
jgi:hypothetical protein